MASESEVSAGQLGVLQVDATAVAGIARCLE